jgi:hypothetical protein
MGAEAMLFEDAEPSIQRQDVGDDIVLICRGLVVASFRRNDPIGRDVAIASLIRLGMNLTTDTIGALCSASHGWVCRVRVRMKEGGLETVVARAKRGRRRKIVGRAEQRLRTMHAEGASLELIAASLGVSRSLVGSEVKRLGLPRRGWGTAQGCLPGVGSGGGAAAAKARKAYEMQRNAPAVSDAPAQKALRRANVDAEASDGYFVETPNDTGAGGQSELHDDAEHAPPADNADVAKSACIVGEEDAETPEAEVSASVSDAVAQGNCKEIAAALATLEACGERLPTSDELKPGAQLPSGPAEHPCRYAGTVLLCAAAMVLGVKTALDAAHAVRPKESVYDASQVVLALMACWAAGYGSLEAMHERDARALGVILGLERSPCVKTLYRAIAQIGAVVDPIELGAALMKGVLSARLPDSRWFGVDQHFKVYSGDAPIDKGWDSKRRIAAKGLSDVFVTDERGWTWHMAPVAAGSSLSQHLLPVARTLRGVLGDAQPIVLAFDRGGFDFEELDALQRQGFLYIGYVPASVTLPHLSSIAPTSDGVGEIFWHHTRLRHPARLLVERDGTDLIPAVTNLPTLVDAAEAMRGLRAHRGAQENSFKAARSFAHIDRLVDRGGATRASDDRLMPNPARAALKDERKEIQDRITTLEEERPGVRTYAEINHDRFWSRVEELDIERKIRAAPAKVPRMAVEPDAQRATLKTKNRLLLQPLKLASDNARRWLLGTLGSALAPTERPDDQNAICRTLLAVLRAPGWVSFGDDLVIVTLDLPLPPTPHKRLADALQALDRHSLRFIDGRRRVQFRLAPRPTRATLPSAAGAGG